MKLLIFSLGLIALLPKPAFLDIPSVNLPPWRGPVANHVLGIPPSDTSEVDAAKVAFNHAYAQILAALSQLPPQDRTIHQSSGLHATAQHQPIVAPTVRTFAEDVPRSVTGETPEVYAARLAHLKAVQEATATLPRLAVIPVAVAAQHNPIVAASVKTFAEHVPRSVTGETPEVYAARVAHLKAVQEATATLPRLASIPVAVAAQHQPIVAPSVKTFAENVPRSVTGETPEVYAARVAHLKAVQEATATLPRLAGIPVAAAVQHQPIVAPTVNTFAEHVPRSVTGETPEVYAARLAHLKAVQEATATLPRLASIPVAAAQHHPIVTSTAKTFAEDVPRSVTGETPEVYAARLAHLKALQEATATLPRLAVTPVAQPILPQHPGLHFQNYLTNQQIVRDTPEVAQARAAHAAAFAAALG